MNPRPTTQFFKLSIFFFPSCGRRIFLFYIDFLRFYLLRIFNLMDRRRRKTLPVVKTDYDIENNNDDNDHLEEEQEEPQLSIPEQPPSPPHGHWVRLSEEDDTPHLFRHSVGLEELPGVVTTVKPCGKFSVMVLSLGWLISSSSSFRRQQWTTG